MDFITLYESSGYRIHEQIVIYSAAVITTTHHFTYTEKHYAVNMLFTHSILHTTPPQVAVLICRTENRTKNRTEQDDIR
jgi:hypothetical protein